MRLPPSTETRLELLVRLRGTHLDGSSGDSRQDGGLPYWGLGVSRAVLDWPLNGGMKVIICLLCICADWAQPLVTCGMVSPGHLVTGPPVGKDPGSEVGKLWLGHSFYHPVAL